MSISVMRHSHPRLLRAPDDPDFSFAPPTDPVRRRILENIVADCRDFGARRPWKKIPERPHSPHPYHQLYITFYTAMQASALIEHYAFAWKLTREQGWLERAKKWLLAACSWEHSDRIEEHFYSANRYMQAFALGLDLLGDQLTSKQEDQLTRCLIKIMRRWWPDVEKARQNPAGGHHAVVDNGHFGVAALHLLGKHSEASQWVEAVVERFRCSIMLPGSGCGVDGEPVDGPSFWTWENLWMLQFADALRNVCGIDLYREFPRRCTVPLKWFRYQLSGPDDAMAAGRRPVWSPSLLRLAQEAGDDELRQVALEDPQLGRIYRFGVGVKGSSAECLIAYGPYGYCYYDPAFRARRRPRLPLSRTFTKTHYGETAVLRQAWPDPALVAHLTGYTGGVAHGFSDLQLQWAGAPALRSIACEEAQPVSCGSLPCVGGQNEFVAHLAGAHEGGSFARQRLRSTRLEQEYWLLRGAAPVLLVALRRRPRGVRMAAQQGVAFARLDGRDYLQYPRQPHFNADAGALRLRVRWRREIDPRRPQVLFHTGAGLGGSLGARVNSFALGHFDGEGLVFAVQSQRSHQVEVRIPPAKAALKPGVWHEVAVAWGGFNDPHGRPFIELELDGLRQRCDDGARFGEMGLDSQQLESRSTPRPFYIHPNTLLGFGAAVLLPGTGTCCDLAKIELQCPGRQPLEVDFSAGPGAESGSGEMAFKLNPADLRTLGNKRARLGAGPRVVELLAVYPQEVAFRSEMVPFAPSGLAAGSLRQLGGRSEEAAAQVLASAGQGDALVLALAPAAARVRVERRCGGFSVRTRERRWNFAFNSQGRALLTPS